MIKNKRRFFLTTIFIVTLFLALIISSKLAFAKDEGTDENKTGGGYAATGAVENVSYSAEIYDATSGLPTSDANFILGSRDGYVWIASYSGIIRYDGSNFERLDTSEGLTNGRGLFEDSLGRIWVATNDNGVVVIDGKTRTHFTYKEGLPSSSIRIFEEGTNGDIYVGTTDGVCYIDSSMKLCVIDDERLNGERVLKLDADGTGKIYGQTANGIIFSIEDHKISAFYHSNDLGLEKITTILCDPENDGKLYFGTDSGGIYYGDFGADKNHLKRISASPIDNTHWLSYDCGKVWASSLSVVGFIDGESFHVLKDIPMDSAIEMMTSDYQGNMWFASSTQGVMKVVADNFVNFSEKAGLKEEVTNATCIYNGRLYVGTNEGLRIIDENDKAVEDELTHFIGSARVRCIKEDVSGNLWIAVYNDGLGVICYSKDGEIKNYTTKDGLLSDEIRCCIPKEDGSILCGTNGGLAIIRNGKVERTVGIEDGVKNTVFLTVALGDDGEIYAGSDGDGIYKITENEVINIGRDDGLTSDVIMRIKKDDINDVYWIITSNSIEYMKNGVIKEVTTFPYNNNYDLYFNDDNDMWILSSYGIYVVDTNEMISDNVTDYKLYTIENGLTDAPSSNSYSELDEDGFLYIPVRTGVCKVNVNKMHEERAKVKTSISSIYCVNERIYADQDGVFTIPNKAGRIRITASVMDYTMMNPKVMVYIEGMEHDGIEVLRSELSAIEFTSLKYGDYTLHVKVLDDDGTVMLDNTYKIVKKARFTELPVFRLLMIVLVAFFAGTIVWQILRVTVIKKQYMEISRAKDDAERANSAKTRFLANMSNDIRTPINTIMGMNEMALREDTTGVPAPYVKAMRNYSLDIKNASESLLSLINNLFDMSKIESKEMHLVEKKYDTQEMLRFMVSLIKIKSTQKQLLFDINIDEILPRKMYGDEEKIKQVVLNLLSNAVKYTDNGSITLSVSLEERKDDLCMLRFVVKDTGIGIKDEDIEHIFTAFDRLDDVESSKVHGTGLGLDISRRVAELMDGTLTCQSEYGKGSEFIFTIEQKIIDSTPMGVFMEQNEDKKEGPYVPMFIAPDADILVVDDIAMDLNIIKNLLKPTRVFVSSATNGEEALEKIKDTRFHVVFLDHMMPDMDGVETMERIHEIDPDLPVYALTTNAAVDEEYFKAKGFRGYLSKPVDGRILEKIIMKHLPEEIMKKP